MTPTSMRQGYLQVIRYKTAKLFEAAAQLGAIIGGGAAAVEKAMAVYGMHLGTAFQLIDDVLDYSGAEVETGKHLGDDLAEGKPTLPLIFVLQQWQSGTGGLRTPGHREWWPGRLSRRFWRPFVPPVRSTTRDRKPRSRLNLQQQL
jgi:hypothetical protein